MVLLILNFEFLPLPEELNGWSAQEKIFRHPDYPYARIKDSMKAKCRLNYPEVVTVGI